MMRLDSVGDVCAISHRKYSPDQYVEHVSEARSANDCEDIQPEVRNHRDAFRDRFGKLRPGILTRRKVNRGKWHLSRLANGVVNGRSRAAMIDHHSPRVTNTNAARSILAEPSDSLSRYDQRPVAQTENAPNAASRPPIPSIERNVNIARPFLKFQCRLASFVAPIRAAACEAVHLRI